MISPSSDSAILSNTESRLGGIEVQRRSLVVDQQLAGKSRGRGMKASFLLILTGDSV